MLGPLTFISIEQLIVELRNQRTDDIIAGMDGRDKSIVLTAKAIQGAQNCRDAVIKHVFH